MGEKRMTMTLWCLVGPPPFEPILEVETSCKKLARKTGRNLNGLYLAARHHKGLDDWKQKTSRCVKIEVEVDEEDIKEMTY